MQRNILPTELLPPISLNETTSNETSPRSSSTIQTILSSLNMTEIPPHPTRNVFQRGGQIQVEIKNLFLDPDQKWQVNQCYEKKEHFLELFSNTDASQKDAFQVLEVHGLNIRELDDVGNRWSTRWSTVDGKDDTKRRVLLQCQCGSSSSARKSFDDAHKIKLGIKVNPNEWSRRMPYDFTGCLAHIDITYSPSRNMIFRIAGILEHNSGCEKQEMQRLPAVPLHPHVWQIALKQLEDGASIAGIQNHNRSLYNSTFYEGQSSTDPAKANCRYLFLPQDSSRLYRMHARIQGVNLSETPENNIDAWLDPKSPEYKPELAAAIFHYHARHSTSERFKVCIHTEEMRKASWKYAHRKQLIFDGTFGICDRRLLLFIGMGIDENRKGVPLVFLLFSAPTGSQATHAGYDSDILTELLRAWVKSLGKGEDGSLFCPKVAITDTDTKERAAFITVWCSIYLLLCKFHTRNAWANKRKTLIKTGTTKNFDKERVVSRLRALDKGLIATEDFRDACALVEEERKYFTIMSTDADSTAPAKRTIMEKLVPLWKVGGAKILGTTMQEVVPTTNRLESFNGLLKQKYIHRYQKGGRRLRFDLLIYFLVSRILPGIFLQRSAESAYYEWLSGRFSQQSGGQNLTRKTKPSNVQDTSKATQTKTKFDFTWWTEESQLRSQEEAAYIVQKKRIGTFKWLDACTLAGTCASSHEDTRLLTHKRYQMLINYYGWAVCSCPSFSEYGVACKHLWAFRIIISSTHTPYCFIFPASKDEAAKIYTTIFTPSPIPSQDHPDLQKDSQLPPLVQNQIASVSADIGEVISTFAEKEEASPASESSDSEGETTTKEFDLIERNGIQERQAIIHQVQSRLAHDIRMVLPRLYGMHQSLKDLGSNTTDVPGIEEFLRISDAISQFQGQVVHQAVSTASTSAQISTLSHPTSIQPMKEVAKDDTQATKEVKDNKPQKKRTLLLPPSPERNQKRKRSTALF
ncbi:hypothetical protein M422DRAFT_780089 [Sphaerobolus stellatus SS14]|uniref:SWIM-type domain-containing protein n=1 Tax=Sphaerobolus stellatus (strain SS14) TaxID=990650 RepID=A0A0C9VU79_SPHS4|nr:hypothetical protein M422DRAFT_780089 [Sphaerobolus stellatus SS14]